MHRPGCRRLLGRLVRWAATCLSTFGATQAGVPYSAPPPGPRLAPGLRMSPDETLRWQFLNRRLAALGEPSGR